MAPELLFLSVHSWNEVCQGSSGGLHPCRLPRLLLALVTKLPPPRPAPAPGSQRPEGASWRLALGADLVGLASWYQAAQEGGRWEQAAWGDPPSPLPTLLS